MSTAELRKKVKATVDGLNPSQLKSADKLLKQLRADEIDATDELLHIPGFMQSFQRGVKDIAAGRVTSVEKLRRKR